MIENRSASRGPSPLRATAFDLGLEPFTDPWPASSRRSSGLGDLQLQLPKRRPPVDGAVDGPIDMDAIAAAPAPQAPAEPVALALEPASKPRARPDVRRLLADSPDALAFLAQAMDLDAESTWVLDSAVVPALDPDVPSPTAIVSCDRLNDLRGINRFFMRVNHRLRRGGVFAIRVRTLEDDRDQLQRKCGSRAEFYARWGVGFLWKRVLPKLRASRYCYFVLSGGRNRALSKTEALGRLVYCGFKILDTRRIDGLLYVLAARHADPAREIEPSYWPIFKMSRIGQGGKPIGVYKLRTMYPYSDSLQSYVYERKKLAVGGKFQDDFRVTDWGRIFRRLWLDELPMLINWLRGDLKFVGVRPLSRHYLSLYPSHLVEYRKRFKPGLVPPYYADLPRGFDEIVRSEEEYLRAYEQHGWRTDLRYLSKAIRNVIFRGVRSS